MNRVWRVAAHDVARVREMSAKLRVSPFLAQVILARGAATTEAGAAFLAKKLTDLHDPETLPGVSQAADRIVAAVQAGRRVTSNSICWPCRRQEQKQSR